MKNFIVGAVALFMALTFANCSKDIMKSSHLSKHGYLMIQSIDVERDAEIDRWVTFTYNDDEQLVRAEQGQRNYEYEYDEQGRLLQIFMENTTKNTRIKADSFVYDHKDRVVEKYQYTHINDPSELSTLWLKYTYDYNLAGHIKTRTMIFLDNEDEDYERVTEYKWEGDNYTYYKLSDNNGVWYEANLTYDGAFNYQRHHPFFLQQEFVQSHNNPIFIEHTEVKGDIDLFCYECDYKYKFDANGAIIEEEREFIRDATWIYNY